MRRVGDETKRLAATPTRASVVPVSLSGANTLLKKIFVRIKATPSESRERRAFGRNPNAGAAR